METSLHSIPNNIIGKLMSENHQNSYQYIQNILQLVSSFCALLPIIQNHERLENVQRSNSKFSCLRRLPVLYPFKRAW